MSKRPGKLHKSRGGSNGSAGEDSVVLTHESTASTICSGLDERQPESIAYGLLSPLLKGKPIALVVEDPRLPKRKRVDKPVLFLTPLTTYGRLSSRLMIALETHGCEVVDTREAIKPMVFVRLGISFTLAKVLATELNLVFTRGDTHGNT